MTLTRFRDLAIGQRFEFDHSGLSFHTSLPHGPYVKRSARTYSIADRDLAYHMNVGSVNVKVRTDDTCGGY